MRNHGGSSDMMSAGLGKTECDPGVDLGVARILKSDHCETMACNEWLASLRTGRSSMRCCIGDASREVGMQQV